MAGHCAAVSAFLQRAALRYLIGRPAHTGSITSISEEAIRAGTPHHLKWAPSSKVVAITVVAVVIARLAAVDADLVAKRGQG